MNIELVMSTPPKPGDWSIFYNFLSNENCQYLINSNNYEGLYKVVSSEFRHSALFPEALLTYALLTSDIGEEFLNYMQELPSCAFDYLGIDKLVIPENIISINADCFHNAQIRELYLPKSLKGLSRCAFEYMGGKIIYPGTKKELDSIIGYGPSFYTYNTIQQVNRELIGEGIHCTDGVYKF